MAILHWATTQVHGALGYSTTLAVSARPSLLDGGAVSLLQAPSNRGRDSRLAGSNATC
jgi:hypothetical protein